MKNVILTVFLLIFSPPIIFAQTYAEYKVLAEHGDADAQYNLAMCYAKGNGVAKNPYYATAMLKKAAEQGCAEAQYNLAICYANGNGVTQSDNEAIKWLKKAARQNFSEAKQALIYIGESW